MPGQTRFSKHNLDFQGSFLSYKLLATTYTCINPFSCSLDVIPVFLTPCVCVGSGSASHHSTAGPAGLGLLV